MAEPVSSPWTIRSNRAQFAQNAAVFGAIAAITFGITLTAGIPPLLLVALLSLLLAGIALARGAADDHRALYADENGVYDNSGYVPGGLVRWEEIAEITPLHTHSPLLLIRLHDPDRYLRGLPLWKRFLIGPNVPLCGTPCVVDQQSIAMPIAEAVQLLNDARRQYTTAIPTVAPTSAHWWTAVPPEERTAQPLRLER